MFSEISIIFYQLNQFTDPDQFHKIFKQKPHYNFGGIALSKTNNVQYIQNDHLHIFIHGEIYERFDIIKSIRSLHHQKDEVINTLSLINGSFVLFIVDTQYNEIYIITDRINSRKVYYYKDNSKYVLTTNPKYFKNIDNQINIGGIASYLINGVVFNNNTLYKNINLFDRACIHCIGNEKIFTRSYWEYEFTNEYDGISKAELKKKFGEVLMKSVERRVNAIKPETCYISLSGGYDSRFLLGALRALKNGFNIKTFSYGMETKLKSGDDSIAVLLSKKFGFEHEVIPAYSNDLLYTINMNVEFGFGLANFCDEIDAWMLLRKNFSSNPSSLLFVGDMFYMPSVNLTKIYDKRIPLYVTKIYSWHYLKPFLKILPPQIQKALKAGYNEIYDGILNRLPNTHKFKNLKDFVYLDQRINFKLLNWREYFHGPFIKVAIPLLDNDVLDFIRKLPEDYRHQKSLYKETIQEMFPDLFSFPIAKNVWAYPSWNEECMNNNEMITHCLLGTESLLDSIIPLETICSIIESKDGFKIDENTETQFYKAIRKLSGKRDFLYDLFANYILKNTNISNDCLTIRLLILNKALQMR